MIIFVIQGNRPCDTEDYEKHCKPGLERQRLPGDAYIYVSSDRSVAHGYNVALSQIAPTDDLEAVVFIHPDCEILDPGFRSKVVRACQIPDIGVIGVIGARKVKSLAWWEGLGFGWCHHIHGGVHFARGNFLVEALDGQLMVFTPWAVKNLRFDEDYWNGKDFCGHAHDVDICFQSLAAGKRNMVLDTEVRHWTLGGYGNEAEWNRCNLRWQTKWKASLENFAPFSPSTPSSTPSPS